MTEQEREKISKGVWNGLSKINGHGRGYSRDAWREAVVDPHKIIMEQIDKQLAS